MMIAELAADNAEGATVVRPQNLVIKLTIICAQFNRLSRK
jgi:hypothetical protein